MIIDGVQLTNNSVVSNLSVESGTVFPITNVDIGQMFYLTVSLGVGQDAGLYVYNGTGWETGDITAVIAGNGLTGGGLTGNVQIDVDFTAVASKSSVDFVTSSSSSESATRALADTTLQSNIDTETSSRIASDNNLQAQISTELSNRTAQTSTLTSNLATEVSRATGVEGTLTTDLATEVSRATGVEGTLTTDLATEVSRATGVEGTLTTLTTTTKTDLVSAINETNNSSSSRDTILQNNIDSNATASNAYTDAQIAVVVGGAPATLNTLNELSLAINNDANVASTLTSQIATKLPIAGGTMTGKITLDADPVLLKHAATKQYVDVVDNKVINEISRATASEAAKLNKSGGTMTGKITLDADPVSALHAATKNYVDANISSLSSTTNTSLSALQTHAADTSIHITPAQNTLLDGIASTISSVEINYLDGVTSSVQSQLTNESAARVSGDAANQSYINAQINNLIGSAPGTLNTLQEISAALNNDPNAVSTLTTNLSTKMPLANGTFTGPVNLPSNYGTSGFSNGTGDGATYATHNFNFRGWWGMGMADHTNTVNGIYNFRTGTWDVKGNFKINGVSVYSPFNKPTATDVGLGILSKDTTGQDLLITTSYGYTRVGMENSTYSHFYTSANTGFYFGKAVEVNGLIRVYGTSTYMASSEMRVSNNVVWHAGNDGSGSGLDADLLDGIDSTGFIRNGVGVLKRGNVLPGAKITNTPNEGNAGLSVYQSTLNADSYMAFHIAGDFATFFGLDGTTNKLSVGGWSMGANSYAIYHEGNKPTAAEIGAGGLSAGNTWTASNTFTGNINVRGAVNVGTTNTTIDQAIGVNGSNIMLGNTSKGLATYKDLKTLAGNTYLHTGNVSTVNSDIVTEKVFQNPATMTVNRQSKHTVLNKWTSTAVNYTFNRASFQVGDKITINSMYLSTGLITIIMTSGAIFLPDGTNAATQSIDIAGTVELHVIDNTNVIARLY